MYFSVIVPLYNRPREIEELLDSLLLQEYKDFEVIIVEDGSAIKAEEIVRSYVSRLDIQYLYKKNEGQGIARNLGFTVAKGDFFIVFDSDVIVPENYFNAVVDGLKRNDWDAFGGPDAAHKSFTDIQKAISYSMTSPLTTGGIRGNKKHINRFHPRSFNMGVSREVYRQTGGFRLARRSEDIEWSIRMLDEGFKVGLIPEAFVYHKRRTDFKQFFKQTFSFGKGRIDIYRLYPSELKFVHLLPSLFTMGLLLVIVLNIGNLLFDIKYISFYRLVCLVNSVLGGYTLILFIHALLAERSLKISLLSICSSYIQLTAYGLGLIQNYLTSVLFKKR